MSKIREDEIVFADQYLAPTPKTCAALVTGAAHRLGRAIAIDLAKHGWPVILHFNNSEEAATQLQNDIVAGGGKAAVIAGNLSDERDVSLLIQRAVDIFGPVGLLINNASVFEWDDAATATTSSLALHMNLHVSAPLILCQNFVELLPEHQGGLIINMVDSRVLNPSPKHLTYTLSKCGLWTLTRTLAHTLAPRVRVNGIGPGPTLPHKGQSAEEFRARCARLPLQRPASLTDICQAINFLIFQKAITGQLIALDGGDHLVGHYNTHY